MSRTRAQRRHHRNRLVVKRLKEETRYRSTTYPVPASEERLRAVRRARTGTPCSCSMCGSARKLHGNGNGGKTRQERNADLKAQDLE